MGETVWILLDSSVFWGALGASNMCGCGVLCRHFRKPGFVAFVEDFREKGCGGIGNFWCDVRLRRDTIENPGERGVHRTLGTPAPGFSIVFLLHSEVTHVRQAEP